MRFRHVCVNLLVAFLSATLAAAQATKITRAYADKSGVVHIVSDGGQDTTVPKNKGQIGAEEIIISNDRRTAGWLVVYPYGEPDRGWENLYGELVLWRNGKVLRRFDTEQVFWSWGFWQDGKQIRFHTGPLHHAGRFELHDLETGRLLAAVDEEVTQTLPDWAESLDP
jgi:hypothetical protein